MTTIVLITVQNLVTVSHTVCAAFRGSQEIFGMMVPLPLAWLALETRPSTICLTMPNLIAVGRQ